MMFRLFLATACVCALAAPAWTQGESTAQPTGKVAYVDIDRVTSKAKPINDVMEGIQGQIKDLQDQIESRRRKIRDLETELKRNDGVLSQQIQTDKRKEVDRLKSELDDLDYKARKEMQKMDETQFAPLLKQILFAIQDVAKENKYDLVLRGEAVLYGSSAADISDLVIKKLDEKGVGKAGAGKSESSASKSTPAAERSVATPEATPAKPEATPTPVAAEPTAAAPKATESVLPVDGGDKPAATPKPAASGRSTKTPETKPQETKRSGTRPVDRQPD